MLRKQDLIHPMTAGDLVHSVCVVAIRDGGLGEIGAAVWECVGVRWSDAMDDAFDVDWRDTQTGERATMTLRRDTPLLFTRITL